MKKYNFILAILLLFICGILSSCGEKDNGVNKNLLNGEWVATKVDVIHHSSCNYAVSEGYLTTYTKEIDIVDEVGDFARFYFIDDCFCSINYRTGYPDGALPYQIKKNNYLIFENMYGEVYKDKKIKIAELYGNEMVVIITDKYCSENCSTIITYKKDGLRYKIEKDNLIGKWELHYQLIFNEDRTLLSGSAAPDDMIKYPDLRKFQGEIVFSESSLITATGESFPYTIANNYLSSNAYSGTVQIIEYSSHNFTILFKSKDESYNAILYFDRW